jgi:hypothetical protein
MSINNTIINSIMRIIVPYHKIKAFPIRNEEQKQRETRGEISKNGETSVKYRAKRAIRAKLAIYF